LTVSRRLNIELPADERRAITSELLEGALDAEEECGDDYADEDEDDVRLCIQEAADILDRLFRIASKVRSPATRTVSSKALKFQLPDPASGVDLFDQYTTFDQGHVQEMFRHNGIDLNASNVTYLVDRMSRAITTRRRILAHGKRHRSKVAYAAQTNQTQPKVEPRHNKQEGVTHLAQIPRLAVSAAGLSNPTTATFLDPNKAILDAKSNVSESVYAPTARGTDNEAAEVPPPPDIGNDRYFECPYCFFLCSKEYTRDKSWRYGCLSSQPAGTNIAAVTMSSTISDLTYALTPTAWRATDCSTLVKIGSITKTQAIAGSGDASIMSARRSKTKLATENTLRSITRCTMKIRPLKL
jgi:hypothetical protein